jgi:hypothetical protein
MVEIQCYRMLTVSAISAARCMFVNTDQHCTPLLCPTSPFTIFGRMSLAILFMPFSDISLSLDPI